MVDLSEGALARVRERLGPRASGVRFLQGDARTLELDRSVDLWHDRAVFHFLTDPQDRRRYLGALRQALRPGGHLILSTFAKDGPTRCSGLEVCRYDCEDMMAELHPGFRLLDWARESHVTPFKTVQEFCYGFFRNEG